MTFRLFPAAALLLALGLAACDNGTASSERAPTDDLNDQASYILGHELGYAFYQQQQQLAEQDVQFDEAVVRAGFNAGLRGDTLPYDNQEVQRIMMAFQDSVMTRASGTARTSGTAFRAEFAAQEGVEETESGLLIRTLREGSGANPTENDAVQVHYEGRLTDGEVFDSSYQRGEPATFPLAGVIPGFAEGIQLMQPGGEYELVIPPDMAYGDSPQGPGGPGQTLIFRIELLGVNPS